MTTLRHRELTRVVEEILHDACWWIAARTGQFAIKSVLLVDAGSPDPRERSDEETWGRQPLPLSDTET